MVMRRGATGAKGLRIFYVVMDVPFPYTIVVYN
jgi:hypothetical protein